VGERQVESAVARAEAASAVPECARVLVAYGGLLAGRDDRRAHELFGRAQAIAQDLGLAATLPTASDVPKRPARQPGGPTLVQEGETWELAFGASRVRLKESRGVEYLARLLAEPAREIPAP